MSDELSRFVHEALGRGHAKAEIRATLLEADWPRDAVDKALDAFADVEFPLPVPRPRPYLSARDAFVYLITFSALYAAAISLGSLSFLLIDYWLPDATTRDLWVAKLVELRWASSWLMITFPAFLWMSRRSYVAARLDPERRSSRIRKWLTYLTLFVAASVLVGDLVTLVFNLLAGELGSRFLLKVLVVAAIAGAVLVYFMWDLRQHEIESGDATTRHPLMRALTGTTVAVVALALASGLWVAGSPGTARQERFDDRREADLTRIADAIDRFWKEREALPESLDQLTFERTADVASIRDPSSRRPYEYRILAERSYELCATFSQGSDQKDSRRGLLDDSGNRFWEHPAGRACFDVEVREAAER